MVIVSTSVDMRRAICLRFVSELRGVVVLVEVVAREEVAESASEELPEDVVNDSEDSDESCE